MAVKWSLGRWNSFRWGQSTAFEGLLDAKTGNTPKFKLIWHLDAGDQDITRYYISGGSFAQEKERPPARLTAGDTTLTLDNSTGAFSENASASLLYGINYHNRKISLDVGLELADGSIEYYRTATMYVSDVNFSSDNNEVVLHLYDSIGRLLNNVINQTPAGQTTPTQTGTGDGKLSSIATMPFKAKTETWTLTCTLGGADGVATFSVVGSVSGNVGTATSGTEFFNTVTGGIRFTISRGTVDWVIGDKFIFTTAQMMEWTAFNPIKILWSILTGYNWDTNVQDPWYARSAQLDPTQSSTNVDLDYAGFSNAIDLASAYFILTGFIPWDYNLADALEEINLHFLGAFPIDGVGRISVKIFRPELYVSPRLFADTKKNMEFSYIRDTRDVINKLTINYRKTTDWPWSDDDQIATLDGTYVASDAASYAALGNQWYAPSDPFTSRWYNAAGDHVTYLATRLLDKYSLPLRRFTIKAGIDGLESQIGDYVNLTDSKLGFTNYPVEIMKRELAPDSLPLGTVLTAEDNGTVGVSWSFLGSSANEGDGISPQAASFDLASLSDKSFIYLGTTGVTAVAPAYVLF